MSVPAIRLIQGTRDPFAVVLAAGSRSFATCTGVQIYVHRAYGSEDSTIETWTMTSVVAVASSVSASYAPTASGAGAVTVAGETIKARPILSFSGGAPDVEAPYFVINVEER